MCAVHTKRRPRGTCVRFCDSGCGPDMAEARVLGNLVSHQHGCTLAARLLVAELHWLQHVHGSQSAPDCCGLGNASECLANWRPLLGTALWKSLHSGQDGTKKAVLHCRLLVA